MAGATTAADLTTADNQRQLSGLAERDPAPTGHPDCVITADPADGQPVTVNRRSG